MKIMFLSIARKVVFLRISLLEVLVTLGTKMIESDLERIIY